VVAGYVGLREPLSETQLIRCAVIGRCQDAHETMSERTAATARTAGSACDSCVLAQRAVVATGIGRDSRLASADGTASVGSRPMIG
jgi:hypothetical protein